MRFGIFGFLMSNSEKQDKLYAAIMGGELTDAEEAEAIAQYNLLAGKKETSDGESWKKVRNEYGRLARASR